MNAFIFREYFLYTHGRKLKPFFELQQKSLMVLLRISRDR